jgi:hypothetical protein
MNLYRIIVRSEDGSISAEQTAAASLRQVPKVNDQQFELLEVERVDPVTGAVVVFAVR